jgi:cytochrome c oxidase subunit 1
MTFAGSFGVPRRHWDISFSQSPFDVPFNPAVDLFLAMVGIGAIIGVTGAVSFILIAVKSVFFGEAIESFPQGTIVAGIPQGLTKPPVHPPNVDELNERLHAPGNGKLGPTPGTVVLVGVFFLAFMLYYFTNWKLLSFLWKIG